MTETEAAKAIADLIRAGYLQQSGSTAPGGVAVRLQDEFVVWHPAGVEHRPEIMQALREEMGW